MNVLDLCEHAVSSASGIGGGGVAFVLVFALFLFSDIGFTIYELNSIGHDQKQME